MIYLILFVVASLFMTFGFLLGARLARPTYGGKIVISETLDGLKFNLELAGDPEFLVSEHHVVFLIDAPNYEELLSQ